MDLADLQRLVDAFEASEWNEIHLAVDGVEVHLSTTPGGLSPAAAPPAGVAAHAAPASAGAAAGGVAAAVPPPAPAGSTAADTHAAGDGSAAAAAAGAVSGTPFVSPGPAVGAVPAPPAVAGDPVLAPSPGIFWRSPAPGQPPFVEVGSRVEADTVVCIVELMKLMNRVSAGRAGVVTAIPVGNGIPVEKGDPIVYIQSDPA